MLHHRSSLRTRGVLVGAGACRSAVPLLAAAAALAFGHITPLVSPLLVAMLVGVLVGNTPLRGHWLVRDQQRATKVLLRAGVVLLGLQLPLQDLAVVGVPGVVVIVTTVVATFVLTCYLGDRLGIDQGLVSLIAVGFSICGASAIAAVESGVRRRDEDVALSIAMVTLFGTTMIVALPLAGSALGMSDLQLGVWAGASVHEVAQVVAAASVAGTGAVAVATTVKLGRVSLIVGAYLAARRRDRATPADGARPAPVPWFVAGFACAVAVRSTGLLDEGVLSVLSTGTTMLLASAMFGLGLMLRFASLFPVPGRVLLLAAASTAVAAMVSLVLTLALF